MIIEEDTYIEHFGVKGMQWGVRKGNSGSSKPSGKEIKTARKSHNDRVAKIKVQATVAATSKNRKAQTQAAAQIRKLAKEASASKDASVGAKLTRGERASTYLVVGPLAYAVNKVGAKNRETIATSYIKMASTIKVSDFDER